MSTIRHSTESHQITGIIERITFHNPETGFCVLRVHVQGHREVITVVGITLAIQVGESIQAQGHWIQHYAHGKQFRAESIEVLTPTTLTSIEKYLGSGLIKGIGPHFAKKLVETFGDQVFEIIESQPDKLLQLEGIGKNRQQQLLGSWKAQKVMRELMLFLQSYQISSARAVRIYKTYGDEAIKKIKENPYRLAKEVYGIGFKTSDILAQQMGITADSPLRAGAGIQQVMQSFSNEGHCAVPIETLESHTQALLEVSLSVIQQAIEKAILDQQLIKTELENKSVVALTHLYRTEQGVATQLKRLLLDKTLPWGLLDKDQITVSLENNKHIQLSNTQRAVLVQALQAKMFLLTGGPGVGKTTIVKSLLGILQHFGNLKISLCAPTGRAAQRLTETTQHPAKTIHRLLGFDPKRFAFKHNSEDYLDVDFLIVDEVSMLDITLAYQLLKAIPSQAAVLFIGDSDQLPSVGPGRVLADLLEIQRIPFAQLTQVFRQAATSSIIVNAHRINQGQMPFNSPTNTLSDFYFIESNTPQDIQAKIIHLVKDRIPKQFQLDSIYDIQVLTPMNRGTLGTYHLNNSLQEALNPNPSDGVERFGTRFLVADKVMQKINNYDKEVFNGDIGYINAIDAETEKINIKFSDKTVAYNFNELDELNLAYAMSIHKSQGSEYPAVIIPVTMQHYRMLARNLLYTGVTRGKKLVILIGEKKALGIGVQTTQNHQRLTQLRQRIMEVLP